MKNLRVEDTSKVLRGLKLTKKGFDVLIENSKEVKEYIESLKIKAKEVSEAKKLKEKLSEMGVETGIRRYLFPEEEIFPRAKDNITGYSFRQLTRIMKYKGTRKKNTQNSHTPKLME